MEQNTPQLRAYLRTSGTPWLRWAARFFDGIVLIVLIAAVVAQESDAPREPAQLERWLWILLWIPLEAILLSRFTFTPGKWIFGLSVLHRDGSRLTFGTALKRSVLVFFCGLGAGFLAPVTKAWSFWKIANEGETTWDRDCATMIVWRRSYVRTCVGVFFALVLLHFISRFKEAMSWATF